MSDYEAMQLQVAFSKPEATAPMVDICPIDDVFSGGLPEITINLITEDALDDLRTLGHPLEGGTEEMPDIIQMLVRRLIMRTAQHIALNYAGCVVLVDQQLGGFHGDAG